MSKKKLVIILSSVLVLIVSSILVFSYAYIKPNIIVENETKTITKARELNLVYTGESEINESSILPGQSFTKTFNVENKNDVDTKFNIYIENILNEFDDSLVYTLVADDVIIIEDKPLPITNEGKSYLLAKINISAARKINYKLIITFKNTEEDQTNLMNKTFKGTLGIDTDPNLEDCTKPEIISTNEWSTINNEVSLAKIGYSSSGVDYYEYYVTNNENESVDEDTIPTGTTDDTLIIEEEGINYIYYRTVAKSGLRSLWSSPVQTMIDKTPPTCTISGNPSGWVTTATLSIVSYDSGSGLASSPYSWDGTNYSTTLTKSIAANGTYTAYVKDALGNINSCEVSVTKIETTNPTITFGTNGTSTWVKSASTKVTVADTESGPGTLKYLWNTSTSTPAASSFTSTFTNGGTISGSGVTGTYYLWILAYDAVGHYTINRSNAFYFDNTAPGCSITPSYYSPSGTGWTQAVTLTAYPVDYESGGAYTNLASSNNSATVTTNGTHTIYAYDAVGNVGSCSINVTNIDRSAPGAPSMMLANEYVGSHLSYTTAITAGSSDNVGIWKYQYSHDSGSTWSDDPNKVWAGAGFSYYACARAVDYAGNTSGWQGCILVNAKRLYIRQLYRAERVYGVNSNPNYTNVSEDEVTYWDNWSGYGDYLAAGIFASQEFKYHIIGNFGSRYAINRVYIGALGREGDSGGLDYYGTTVWNGYGPGYTITTLLRSGEAQNVYSKAGLAYYGVTQTEFDAMYNRY